MAASIQAAEQRPSSLPHTSLGWHRKGLVHLTPPHPCHPSSGTPPCPLCSHLQHSLHPKITGRLPHADLERNHGVEGRGTHAGTEWGQGPVLLCFTLENSINNAKSKRLQASRAGLWDSRQPIRHCPFPHQGMSSWLLPHTKAPRELVLCWQCPKPQASPGPADDAQVLGPNKVQGTGGGATPTSPQDPRRAPTAPDPSARPPPATQQPWEPCHASGLWQCLPVPVGV